MAEIRVNRYDANLTTPLGSGCLSRYDDRNRSLMSVLYVILGVRFMELAEDRLETMETASVSVFKCDETGYNGTLAVG